VDDASPEVSAVADALMKAMMTDRARELVDHARECVDDAKLGALAPVFVELVNELEAVRQAIDVNGREWLRTTDEAYVREHFALRDDATADEDEVLAASRRLVDNFFRFMYSSRPEWHEDDRESLHWEAVSFLRNDQLDTARIGLSQVSEARRTFLNRGKYDLALPLLENAIENLYRALETLNHQGRELIGRVRAEDADAEVVQRVVDEYAGLGLPQEELDRVRDDTASQMKKMEVSRQWFALARSDLDLDRVVELAQQGLVEDLLSAEVFYRDARWEVESGTFEVSPEERYRPFLAEKRSIDQDFYAFLAAWLFVYVLVSVVLFRVWPWLVLVPILPAAWVAWNNTLDWEWKRIRLAKTVGADPELREWGRRDGNR
jgi:tetratricopeptide (TPR) repeat protein